jgi:hypothetical protein
MFRLGVTARRFWRPLIAIVAAYAVAAQSLLIALGGFAALAHADTRATAFVLCAHNSEGAPVPPVDGPYPGCNHCIFCFAGAHHAVIGSPVVAAVRISVASTDVAPTSVAQAPPRRLAHSIANPRGPPLRA